MPKPSVSVVPIASLVADPDNARHHPEVNRSAIARSMQAFGAGRSVVIDGKGVVRAGNGALEGARAAGMTEAVVIETDGSQLVVVKRPDWTPQQALAYALADNKTTDLSEFYVDALRKTLETLGEFAVETGDPTLLEATGFDEDELEALLSDESGDVQVAGHTRKRATDDVVEPDTPEPPKVAVTQKGDVWTLGRHTLLCGDSTRADDVKKLMNGERAPLCFSDPPYGVAYKSSGTGKKNAIMGDITQAEIPLSFAIAVENALDENARIYLCGGSTNLSMMLKLFDHYLHQQPRIIIWDKGQFVLRPNNYHAQFELIFFGWKGTGGGPKNWYGDRTQSDVWRVKRDAPGTYEHPTQKPVELPAIGISNSCPPDGIVFEPFAGSGSTLLAAEQLGRVCRAMEIDPRFCDVVVSRWESLTGKKAKRA